MKKIAITEIAKDIAQELLSMENRQRKLKGDRFNALLASVERLITDSVSIRFMRSRYNWALEYVFVDKRCPVSGTDKALLLNPLCYHLCYPPVKRQAKH